jgi:polysaccharide pyruvyl transferase WcaK-like protein
VAGKRVVLLNDTSNWYHWGCTGTSTAVHQSMTEKGFRVEGVAIRGIYGLKNPPGKIEDFDSGEFLEDFSGANRWMIREIKDADVVVINGEGSLHGLTDYTLSLLYVAYCSKVHFGKNVRIINHSCYPEISLDLKDTLAWKIYKKVYSVIDFAAIREPVSLELMRKAGLSAHQSFDCLPLYITANYSCNCEGGRNRIVLAPPVAWKHAGIESFSGYIREMSLAGHEISVLTGAAAFPASDDEEFLKSLSADCPDGWINTKAGSMREWLDCIATARLLVSGRFHHAIAAAVLNTPFILLDSNTPKNRGISEVMKAPPPIQLQDGELLQKMLDLSSEVLGRNESRNRDNASIVKQLCALAMENFRGLEEINQLSQPKRKIL